MRAEVVAALGMVACALADLAIAVFVWSRRQDGAGRALTAVLLALIIWNLANAAELLILDPVASVRWGDLKYVGIGALVPAWLAFVLCWTGHARRVTPRLVALLTIEPLLLLGALAVPSTHDLVRYLDPADVLEGPPFFVSAGPLFWIHLAYLDALMLGATGAFIVSLLRRSRAYGLQAAVLTGAALLPWVTNLGYNFDIDPLSEVDLTPVAFTVSAAVLAWGMFRQHLLRLAPVAYRQIVAGMSDAVFLLDMFGHLVETNPAAEAMLEPGPGPGGRHRRRMVLPERLAPWAVGDGPGEVSLQVEGADARLRGAGQRAAGPPRAAQGEAARPARRHRPAPARARGGPAARGPVPDRRHPQPLAASRRPARARGRAARRGLPPRRAGARDRR